MIARHIAISAAKKLKQTEKGLGAACGHAQDKCTTSVSPEDTQNGAVDYAE